MASCLKEELRFPELLTLSPTLSASFKRHFWGTSEEFPGLSRKDLKANMFGRHQVLTSAENVNTLGSFYYLLPRSEYFRVSAWSGLSMPRKLELGLKGKPWKLKDDWNDC